MKIKKKSIEIKKKEKYTKPECVRAIHDSLNIFLHCYVYSLEIKLQTLIFFL